MPGHRGGEGEVYSPAITTAADARRRDGADGILRELLGTCAPQPGDYTGAMEAPAAGD